MGTKGTRQIDRLIDSFWSLFVSVCLSVRTITPNPTDRRPRPYFLQPNGHQPLYFGYSMSRRPSSSKFLFISPPFCLIFFLSLGLRRHQSRQARLEYSLHYFSFSFSSNLFLLPNTDGAHHLPMGPATSRSLFVCTVLHDHLVRL
jgi:hypothetical protein